MAESYDGDIKLSVSLKPGDIKSSAQKLSKSIESIFDTTKGQNLDKAFNRVLNSMDKINTRSNTVINKMHELENTKVYSKDYQKLEKELDKLRNKSQELEDELGTKTQGTKPFVQVNEALDKVYAQMEKVESKMIEMEEAGTHFTPGVDTEQYQKLSDTLSQLNNQQRMNIANWDVLRGKEEQVESETDELEDSFQDTGNYTQRTTQQWRNAFDLIKQSITNLPQLVKSGISQIPQLFTNMASRIGTVLKSLPSIFMNGIKLMKKYAVSFMGTLKTLASTITGKVKGALRSLGSHFSIVSKNAGKANLSIGKLVKQFLTYGLGIGSIYMLFNKLRSTVAEGIKEVVQINKGANKTNESMTALTSSFTAFKRSITTAAVPLINTLAPALTRIIDLATEATNSIGKFIAALSGQSTYLKAVKVQKDYAESLNETAKNTKKAKKEAENYLSPLDEINKFQSKKEEEEEDNTNTGIGEGFEEVPIESKIKDWAKKLKDAWANADFTSIGKMLGDKLAEALASINWDKIQSEARRLAQSLATFINGFIQGEFNGIGLGWWIGNAIAEALNTAIEFVNKFLTTVHWDEVGDFFGDMANGWIESFDFDGFFMQFTNALNALGDFLLNFSEKVKWEDLGSNIAKGINKALKELDMAKLAQGISSFIEGVMSSIITFIEDTDWKQVGEKLVEFITNLDWKGILEKAGEGLDALVHAILDFLAGVFGENDPGVIGVLSAAIDTLKAALDNLKPVAEKFYEAVLKPLGDFLWDKLHDALSSIKEILEGLTDVLNGNKSFKEFFDGLSFGQKIVVVLTTVLTALAVVIGVVTAVTGALTIVIGILTSPITLVIAAIVGLIAIGVALYENWDTIKKKAGELWDGIKEGFAKFVDKIKEIVDGIKEHFQHAFETVKRNWNKFTDSIKTAFTNFKTFWTNTWNSIKSTVVSIFESIWNKIKSICNSILGGIEKMVNGVIGGINWLIDRMNDLHIDIPDWMTDAISTLAGVHVESIGFDIGKLSTVSLPRLAQGAVIPPNKEFAAVLGDQKQGMNIETPLETMKQAFRDALSEMGGNTGTQTIQFILPNKKMVAEYVIEGGRILQSSRGSNPFELA